RSLADDHLCRFDDVAHETAGIPVRHVGLRVPIGVGAAHLEQALAGRGYREMRLPLPEAVFTLVGPELCRLPRTAAVGREVEPRDAARAAEGNAARERR